MSTNLHTILSRFSTALVVLTMGCVRAQTTPFDPTPVLDRRTASDRIRFFESQTPRCDYKEIGHITARGDMFSSWNSVVKKVRSEAHEMGGDAVVSLRERSQVNGAIVSPHEISTTESHSLSGTVIRFVNPACRE
jgi:hypothetical protein